MGLLYTPSRVSCGCHYSPGSLLMLRTASAPSTVAQCLARRAWGLRQLSVVGLPWFIADWLQPQREPSLPDCSSPMIARFSQEWPDWVICFWGVSSANNTCCGPLLRGPRASSLARVVECRARRAASHRARGGGECLTMEGRGGREARDGREEDIGMYIVTVLCVSMRYN